MPALDIYLPNGDCRLYCTDCQSINDCDMCEHLRCHICNRRRSVSYMMTTDELATAHNVVQRFMVALDAREREEEYEEEDDDYVAPYGDIYYRRSDRGIDDLLQYYSYQPEWEFHGDGPLYMGMELEVTCDSRRALQNAMSVTGDLCVFKHDGSVAGFEMVTHPMSWEYARDEFPWDALTQMEDDGCEIRPVDNGLHIHVNRAAFTNDAHIFRWEKFLHRNRGAVNRIARRRNNNWCRWTETSNAYYLPDIYARKYARAQEQLERWRWQNEGTSGWVEEYYRRRAALRALQDKYQYNDPPDRYSAINVGNDATIELRCFASTLQPDAALAALGLVAASVRYCQSITSHDVLAASAWRWPTFRDYVAEHATEYPSLNRVIDSAPVPVRATDRFTV